MAAAAVNGGFSRQMRRYMQHAPAHSTPASATPVSHAEASMGIPFAPNADKLNAMMLQHKNALRMANPGLTKEALSEICDTTFGDVVVCPQHNRICWLVPQQPASKHESCLLCLNDPTASVTLSPFPPDHIKNLSDARKQWQVAREAFDLAFDQAQKSMEFVMNPSLVPKEVCAWMVYLQYAVEVIRPLLVVELNKYQFASQAHAQVPKTSLHAELHRAVLDIESDARLRKGATSAVLRGFCFAHGKAGDLLPVKGVGNYDLRCWMCEVPRPKHEAIDHAARMFRASHV